jgi:hypothetical protein
VSAFGDVAPGGPPVISAQLTGAIGELTRFTAGAHEDILRCLATCPLCRNWVLYVLDTVPATGDTDFIAVRLRGVPGEHQRHGDPGHPDGNLPRIRDPFWDLS